MRMTGAEVLVNCLIEQDVDTVFGFPGGAVLFIYDALYEYQDKISHILTCHEQHAAHAADGYARSTGKTGVVIATSGPGASNLVTGIATAYMDSVPMVAITATSRWDFGKRQLSGNRHCGSHDADYQTQFYRKGCQRSGRYRQTGIRNCQHGQTRSGSDRHSEGHHFG